MSVTSLTRSSSSSITGSILWICGRRRGDHQTAPPPSHAVNRATTTGMGEHLFGMRAGLPSAPASRSLPFQPRGSPIRSASAHGERSRNEREFGFGLRLLFGADVRADFTHPPGCYSDMLCNFGGPKALHVHRSDTGTLNRGMNRPQGRKSEATDPEALDKSHPILLRQIVRQLTGNTAGAGNVNFVSTEPTEHGEKTSE